jgi:hypothetical protein
MDLFCGVMHTLLLEYAASNIAGLDLSTSQAGDLLRLMGSFGISNYITGLMLILVGWKARPLALTMLGIIPAAYVIDGVGIRVNSTPYAATQAAWGGIQPMMVYLVICGITFIAGNWITQSRVKKG